LIGHIDARKPIAHLADAAARPRHERTYSAFVSSCDVFRRCARNAALPPQEGDAMSQTVGEFFVERLSEWGVRTIFGFPGDGINGVLRGLEKRSDMFRFVQVRHEEMAAFMASAYAKFSGELGVCLSTGGPGATHLVTGLYDAKQDHMPVLAITGQASRSVRGAHYQQELNLDRLFSDVAEYVQQGETPEQVGVILDRAIRTAKARNGVAVVIMPNDLSDSTYSAPTRLHGYTRSGTGYERPSIVPFEKDLKWAAEVLNAGKKVAMLVGAGALHCPAELVAVADKLQAGCAKALLGKGALPDDLPWVTGCIGLLGTKPSSDMMNECDTLLMVGTGFPWAEFLPKTGQALAVQIDIDATMLGIRYPTEVNLHGEAGLTLRALLPLLHPKEDTGWRRQIEASVKDWSALMEKRAMTPARPVNPQRVAWELSPRLPDNAIITADSGSVANWYARDLKMRRGMKASLSGGLASLGAGTPYALAGKMAYPDRTVIACMGDGAMQMNGLNVMITISKYWKQWSNPRLIVLVLNNRDLNQVTWEERIQLGEGKTESTQSIPDFPYHRYAELLGLRGIFVDNPDRVGAAWDEALAADRPVIFEAYTDPNVPPLPPHITLKDAKHFVSMIPSEPELGSVLKNSAKELLTSVLPGKD
jgi:pyruvate dehydrogenase (quinone)